MFYLKENQTVKDKIQEYLILATDIGDVSKLEVKQSSGIAIIQIVPLVSKADKTSYKLLWYNKTDLSIKDNIDLCIMLDFSWNAKV